MKWPFKKKQIEVWKDPLVLALEHHGIEINNDVVLNTEIWLGLNGIDKSDISFAVEVYKKHLEQLA